MNSNETALPSEIRGALSSYYGGNDKLIVQAIIKREWRAIETIKSLSPVDLKKALKIHNEAEEENKEVKQKSEVDSEKITEIIEEKLTEKARIDGILTYMRTRTGDKDGLT